jgi:Uma2 family endonuclease
MTIIQTTLLLTPEEYLQQEEAATTKSEYRAGELVPMAGGTTNHNRIALSTCTILDTMLELGRCEVFNSDIRLWIAAYELFTYPDLSVVCGSTQYYPGRTDSIINPVVIGEVLSKSTRGYDQGDKFTMYRTVPTLLDYLLIDQYRIHVDHYHKIANGQWLLTEYTSEENVITLESINVEIGLRQIYRRVDWALVE